MKKLIAIAACCCVLSAATVMPVVSYAQESKMDSKMKDKDGSAKMVDGKMMLMKNGSWTAMTSDVTMGNGTKVKTDGTVVMKDGKTKTLKNGDCVKPDGMVKKM
ncbi:MAG: hypothetical protein JWO06_1280 [Bacteroidota bacterium]|nr:hypothetical protein [Bacteroidota bacterium]